jgi:putative component of membrane protein insertase Oxa1/YidC/SpoIIIJ protein YidD
MEWAPTDWEQDVARVYVNERELVRPNTNVKTALISVLLFLLVSGVLVGLVYLVLISVGVSDSIPLFFLCVTVVVLELLFCLKYAVIGTVKLYQHYAPEEIRRRCLFMPTCSEYAILAVRKYGCVVGLCKTYYRLVFLCTGNVYSIHYPWDKN